jgi:hypothetical protein
VGLGVRHALFPDSLAFGAQRPVVVDRWLPVPRRRATLLGPAECLRSRGGTGPPAANRRVGLVERGFSARGGIPPSTDPFLTRLVPGCDSLVPALFRKDRPMPPAGGPCRFPLRYGSCLFSLKLRSFSQAGEGLPVPSRFGSSCPPPFVSACRRLFQRMDSLRENLCPFRVPAATPEPSDGLLWSATVRPRLPHWLTVATSGVSPTASALPGGNLSPGGA